MARILGTNPTNTVTLEPGREGRAVGSLLAVAISQTQGTLTRWWLDVDARTEQGVHRVGSVLTLPPAYLGSAQGQLPSQAPRRFVAYAFAPGAVSWTVTSRAVAGEGQSADAVREAVADMYLTSSENGGALSQPGVYRVDALGRTPTTVEKDWNNDPASTSEGNIIVDAGAPRAVYVEAAGPPVVAAPAYLWAAYGEPTVQGDRWLQAFNTPTAPANGASPRWSSKLTSPGELVQLVRGMRFSRGLWVGLSSTPTTLTIATGGFYSLETERLRPLT